MSKLTVYDNIDDWKKARLNSITATEMASLLGLGYKNKNGYQTNTPSAIMRSKKNGISPVINDYAGVLRRGIVMEPSVGKAVEHDLGWTLQYPEKNTFEVYTIDEERVGATPDCYRILKGKKHVLECKTVGVWGRRYYDIIDPNKEVVFRYPDDDEDFAANSEKGRALLDGDKNLRLVDWINKNEISYKKWNDFQKHPNIYYIVQVLHQLRCMGETKTGYIAGLLTIDPVPLVVFKITLSDFLLKSMKEASEMFWTCYDSDEKYVINLDKTKEIEKAVLSSCKRIY